MKIWDKGIDVSSNVISFTVGDDWQLDMNLVKYDCIASKAHAKMLHKIDLISLDEFEKLSIGLDEIIGKVETGEFIINIEDEDCHTAIENYLIAKIGDAGKKIHTGRSRNDQVLTALRLYEKDSLINIIKVIHIFKDTLTALSKNYVGIPMPGYTHMRKAMPSSVSMWLDSFVESLFDDIEVFNNVLSLIDKSPLGTAAGFGVPVFHIDRDLTCKELGFKGNIENPMYAQITRGKFEGNIINSCSQLLLTLNKLATDLILFSMGEFGFIKLPKNQCTGSSIMPQKINPDVLELVRAKYHEVIGEEFKVKSAIGNLMSGYNRDVQLTKGSVMKSCDCAFECVVIMNEFVKGVEVCSESCKQAMSDELFATEEVNVMVASGKSFRDAYKNVGSKFVKK